MDSRILHNDLKTELISDNNTQTMLMGCQKSKLMRSVTVLLNKDSESHRETEHNRSKKFITHSMLRRSVTTAGPSLARQTKISMVQTRQSIHLINKDQRSKQGVAVVNCCKWNKNYSLKTQRPMWALLLGQSLTVKRETFSSVNAKLRCAKLHHLLK